MSGLGVFLHRRGRVAVLGSAMLVALLSATSVGRAAPVFFRGDSASLAGAAAFEVNGTDLVVTLTNASTGDVVAPSQLLTAVFFDITGAGSLNLTPVSAVLAKGSSVVFGTTDPGNSVGGEWAYQSGLVGAPGGRQYGISSSGLGLFGPHDLFPGSNLQGPVSPAGAQYGITSAGDDLTTGNQAVTGSNAMIKNSVVFTFSGLPADFLESGQIGNVWFQYGTDLSEGGYEGRVPEPLTLFLVLGGVAGICSRRRRLQ